MRKFTLESYLALLENPIYDKLFSAERKLKDEFVKLYKLHQEDIVKNGKVTNHGLAEKVKEASNKWNKAKEELKYFTQHGKEQFAYEEEMRRSYEEMNKAYAEYNAAIAKARKIIRIRNIILWSLWTAYMIYIFYSLYKASKEKEKINLMKKGVDPKRAENTAKVIAMDKQIKGLREKNGCNKTNNPQKCREKIEHRIKILELRKKRYEAKLRKY